MYFGTGLASVGAPSLGFGVEILGTILASLWLKRNLGLDKVTTLWTKLREGQYLKGGNDKINKDADYIVNNPRLHNFLTYLYINE
jgi:hypothetical protein